jgi:uncharacterized protein (TIGR03437 family)
LAAFSQTPAIDTTKGVQNAASFVQGQAVAAGSYAAIFGSNLASGLTLADSIPLGTTLQNVSVTFNGVKAPLGGVVDSQINVQVPWDVLPAGATSGGATVIVNRNGVQSAPFTTQITSMAPGLFYIFTDPTGVDRPTAYNQSDFTFAWPVGFASAPYKSRPAKVNDPATLVLLATGLGPVTVTPPNGAPAKNGNQFVESDTVNKPTVLVGGVPANVVFSGLSETPSVYQINVVLAPNTPVGDAIPVQIQMNGITTTDKLKIAVTQ